MIEAKQLRKYYKMHAHKRKRGFFFSGAQKKETGTIVKALDGVSFCLRPGIYGLLGPNGAGKSTLINVLIGLLPQDSGSVTWNKQNIKKMGKRYRKLLGYMPQQQALYDSFTGRSFLTYFCALKDVPNGQVNDEVERVSSKVNLVAELDKGIGAYSGGMKQRLLIAASLLGNPQFIIMDEPTAGLDPKERVRFRELLREYGQENVVLVATHVVSDVESIANEILFLRLGKIVAQGSVQHLVATYAPGQSLEDVYLALFEEASDG